MIINFIGKLSLHAELSTTLHSLDKIFNLCTIFMLY